MKKHSIITATLTLPLALALAVALASGCSKKESAESEHSEMKMPETQETTPPAPEAAPSGEKPKAAPQKVAELAPLPADVVQLVNSNRTLSVYEQVYYITNSPFTDTEKAQALMSILPAFNRDGQRAVAHSAVNYVHDSTHSLVSTPLLEGKLDRQILSVFMTDTLKRPDEIKISVLKKIAATEGHPMKSEAEELLTAFSRTPTAPSGQQNRASMQQQIASKTD